jgi:predicted ester cyclase
MGIAPTGNRVEIAGMTIDRIEGGKLVEPGTNTTL